MKNKVIQLIKDRKNGLKDDRKLGLIIQGGGLRTSFAGGVMVGLEELGFADVFDCVYGISAGSCCGAYLLSHQTRLGTSIFFEDLPGKKFIQPWKPYRMFNLDYLCDDLMKNTKRLDVGKVLSAKTELKIFITEAKTGILTQFSKNDAGEDLLHLIKAACSYPGTYFPLVKINGKGYLDGGAVKALPIAEAIEEGYTDLLVVATVPKSYKRKASSWSFLVFTVLFIPLLGVNMMKRLITRLKNYNRHSSEIFEHQELHPEVNISVISPDYYVNSVETRAQVLKELAEHGEAVTRRAFR